MPEIDLSCKPCCNLGPCDCCPAPPASLLLDFGAGGMVDNPNGCCDEIAGIIVVDFADCIWSFLCTSDDYYITVSAAIITDGENCYWRASIVPCHRTSPTTADCDIGVRYESTPVPSAEFDCLAFPVTLTQTIAFIGFCTLGTLPATITLSA